MRPTHGNITVDDSDQQPPTFVRLIERQLRELSNCIITTKCLIVPFATMGPCDCSSNSQSPHKRSTHRRNSTCYLWEQVSTTSRYKVVEQLTQLLTRSSENNLRYDYPHNLPFSLKRQGSCNSVRFYYPSPPYTNWHKLPYNRQ
jgi:hypothetical protein